MKQHIVKRNDLCRCLLILFGAFSVDIFLRSMKMSTKSNDVTIRNNVTINVTMLLLKPFCGERKLKTGYQIRNYTLHLPCMHNIWKKTFFFNEILKKF